MQKEEIKVLGEIDHVLKRPEMFLGGSLEPKDRKSYLYYPEEGKMMVKHISISDGIERPYLEILANAADNVQRSRDFKLNPDKIEVTINADNLTIKNYGYVIPIEEHESGGLKPSIVFGAMRSSSNFDDEKRRLLIGKNGLGAKLANIFSIDFRVTVADGEERKIFTQRWTRNMKKAHPPVVKDYRGKSYTEVTYYPDFKRFSYPGDEEMKGFDEDTFGMFAGHCVFVSFTCEVPVILNGKKIVIKDIQEFANLFFKGQTIKKISYQDPKGVYSLCLADTPDAAIVCSFVNGMHTPLNGVHVDAVYNAIRDALPDILKGMLDGVKLTKSDLVKHASIFISTRIDKPKFKSQSKEYLDKSRDYKITINLPPALLKKIGSWDIIRVIYDSIKAKQDRQLKKTDGKRKQRIVDSKNLSDANLAAGKKASECTLILVEGESAKGYPVKFQACYPKGQGNDYLGILTMGGKPLNVMNAKFATLVKNAVFTRVKQALGLREEVNYLIDREYRTLRYGHIWLMEDADNDGKHIAGLIILFFMVRFPSLVERGVLYFYRTPILRLEKGTGRQKERLKFYTISSYEKWSADKTPKEVKRWNHKYFKGLATSGDEEAREDYEDPHIVRLIHDERTKDALVRAFNKTEAKARKRWLENFVDLLDDKMASRPEMSIADFIDKEYIYYPLESNERSIPGLDGMKEGQRKILYGVTNGLFSKKKEMKTIAAAGYISSKTHYRHGEMGLAKGITAITQDFVGANNEPLIYAKDCRGTRLAGGKDAGDPRYTYISQQPHLKYLFRAEDKCILIRRLNDSDPIEYKEYYPIMPLILINPHIGVGVAYATHIPPFFPPHLGDWIKQRLERQKAVNQKPDIDEEELEKKFPFPELVPWYKGFKGVLLRRKNGFTTEGLYEVNDQREVIISELPVTVWSNNYKRFLNKLVSDEVITDHVNYNSENTVSFTLIGWNREKKPINKRSLRLIQRFSYNNLTVLLERKDGNFRPQTFNDPVLLLEEYVVWRLAAYYRRVAQQIVDAEEEIKHLNLRYRFILAVMDGKIVVFRRKRDPLLEDMKKEGFPESLLDEVKTRHYTEEELNKIKEEIEKRHKWIDYLRKTPPEDIWKGEIDEYLANFHKRHPKVVPPRFEGEDHGEDELETVEDLVGRQDLGDEDLERSEVDLENLREMPRSEDDERSEENNERSEGEEVEEEQA